MPETTVLGKKVANPAHYCPEILTPIARANARAAYGCGADLPFVGADLWTAYELSWLNARGVPQVALGNFTFDCQSAYMVESKSLKLYLNSLNQQRYASWQQVRELIAQDLSALCQAPVGVELFTLEDARGLLIGAPEGECLDDVDVAIDRFEPDASLLQTENAQVCERLYSHLLKSNCRITSQPDWGTLQIHYVGNKIKRAPLLRYILGFRLHDEFHEPLVERIFCEILQNCQPQKLTVYARYNRRGGLDINPFRSNFEQPPANLRLVRQ